METEIPCVNSIRYREERGTELPTVQAHVIPYMDFVSALFPLSLSLHLSMGESRVRISCGVPREEFFHQRKEESALSRPVCWMCGWSLYKRKGLLEDSLSHQIPCERARFRSHPSLSLVSSSNGACERKY
jgi:hypothetical protein